jgi:VWFA-related protein
MSERRLSVAVALPLLCACMVCTVSADDRSEKTAPSFHAETELVTVDAVVVDTDGAPVVGLTKDDFQIAEDGRSQTVTHFEAVELPAAPSAAPVSPPTISSNTTSETRTARGFALIFDDVHIPPVLTERARDVIAEFLRHGVRESDRVLLATASGGVFWSARMEAGRERLLALLATLEGKRVPEGSARERMSDYEAIRIFRHQDMDVCKRVLRRFIADGAMLKPGIDELQISIHCDPTVAMRAQEVYERERIRIRATLAALTRVMNGMAVARGRKTVILVSTGFVFDQELEETRRVVAVSRRANAAVYFVDVRGLGMGNEQLFQAHYENPDAWGTAEAVQPPVSTQLSEAWAEAEGAADIAADTGGFSVRNRNDLTSGMSRIADESRAYYLLGYTPKNTARDGRFRKIKVRVNRKNVRVRSRKGYYATAEPAPSVRSDEMPAQMRRAVDAPFEVDGIGLRASAYVFEKGPSGRARVEFVADIELRGMVFEQSDGRHVAAVDALLSVARLEGGQPVSFSETINLRLRPETYGRAQYYPYRKTLNLEPGHYQSRLVVHDRLGGAVGSVAHDFEVPNLDEWRVASPVLTDAATPTTAGQSQPMLVARRDFPGAGTLLCFVEVYGAALDAASGEPRVLLSYTLRRGGEEVARRDSQPMAPVPDGRLGGAFGFSLADLAPGGYDLELQFVDGLSGQRKRLRESFTVIAVSPDKIVGAPSR